MKHFLIGTSDFSSTILLLLTVSSSCLEFTSAQFPFQSVKMDINDVDFFEIHQSNVYIVYLNQRSNRNREFVLKCSSREALDLNLTFSGLDYKISRVSKMSRFWLCIFSCYFILS
jgi:hypothetical protein